MSITSDLDEIDVDSVEFTLEDTFEHLKDLKNEREQELKKLMNIIKNNEVKTLGPNITPEDIRLKRARFVESISKFVAKEQPKDLPIPVTPDFYTETLKELEDEVHNIEELDKMIDNNIKDIRNNIVYMENKKLMFEQMKVASITAAENETATNYEAEMVVTKRYFQDVKKDLEFVVDQLFPDNRGFQDLLCVLTRAMSKGGDDLYINVQPEIIGFVNFLEEADIIQFHPHDKTKIKMRNL